MLRKIVKALPIAFFLAGFAWSSAARSAVTITVTELKPPDNVYELNNDVFSSYKTVSLNFGGGNEVVGVNLGGCGQLQFIAYVTISTDLAQTFTFTASLMNGSTSVQTGSTKLGRILQTEPNKSEVILIGFDAVDFAPGTWTISWTYALDDQSGSGSITLIAPLLASQPQGSPPNLSNLYCSRAGAVDVTATYDSANCYVEKTPPTGFIWNNSYYMDGSAKLCPQGKWDSVHCFIGTPPSGATAFAWNGNWYWTPLYCQ
jgi:hypothetical protein